MGNPQGSFENLCREFDDHFDKFYNDLSRNDMYQAKYHLKEMVGKFYRQAKDVDQKHLRNRNENTIRNMYDRIQNCKAGFLREFGNQNYHYVSDLANYY